MPPANDRRNRDTRVSQVGLCQTVKAFEGDHSQVEGNSLAVELTQRWSDDDDDVDDDNV